MELCGYGLVFIKIPVHINALSIAYHLMSIVSPRDDYLLEDDKHSTTSSSILKVSPSPTPPSPPNGKRMIKLTKKSNSSNFNLHVDIDCHCNVYQSNMLLSIPSL